MNGRRYVHVTGTKGLNSMSFTEIALEKSAFLAFQPSDGLLLDLTDTFACQFKFRSDLLEGHFLTSDSEEHLQDVAFTILKLF